MASLPYPRPTSPAATKAMKGNRRVDTRPEVALRSALHRRGLRFRKDFLLVVDGNRVRPDVVFTRATVAVFVAGCFWHRCPHHGSLPKRNRDYWEPKLQRNVERDVSTTSALRAAGWLVVRVWEHEAVEVAVSVVAQVVAARCLTLTRQGGSL